MNGAKVELYVTNCNNGTADIQAIMHGTDGVDGLYTVAGYRLSPYAGTVLLGIGHPGIHIIGNPDHPGLQIQYGIAVNAQSCG